MQLQAITVSVNYADYLECILENRVHFDRWLIITDVKDKKTQDLCRRYKLDCLLSTRLYENGAIFAKAKALNEGLSMLNQNESVLVLEIGRTSCRERV